MSSLQYYDNSYQQQQPSRNSDFRPQKNANTLHKDQQTFNSNNLNEDIFSPFVNQFEGMISSFLHIYIFQIHPVN